MQRSSSALLLGLVVLSALAVGVAYFVARPASVEEAVAIDPTRADTPASVRASDAPSPLRAAEPAAQQPSVAERAAVALQAERELAEALWVEGRVVFPEGTPLDEPVEVLADGKDFEHREAHRTRVGADGSFRVAFQKDTRAGWLKVDAPHLYLDSPLRVKLPAKQPVTLELALGALVAGRIEPPPGVEQPGELAGGKAVTLQGWSGSGANAQRSGKVGPDLRFELRGVPPNLKYWVRCDPGVWPEAVRENLKLGPGETLELALAFVQGARVSGVVRDEQGAPVAKAAVSVESENGAGWSGSDRSSTTRDDGSFELRGVRAGTLTLRAGKQGFLAARAELGQVGDGEGRSDLSLVLASGSFVAGRVTWPDGTPAGNANVTVEQPTSEEASGSFVVFGAPPSIKVDASGAFHISGLGPGPYELTAVAKRTADAGTQAENTAVSRAALTPRARAARWTARVEGVPADTDGLALVLQSGLSLSGRVTDDQGAPVERFSVHATLFNPERPWGPAPQGWVNVRSAGTDGSFVLEGLSEGRWRAYATAPGFAEMERVEFVLPGQVEALQLVLPRASTVSGRVLDPDGKPVHKASVEVMRVDVGGSGVNISSSAQTDAQGKFELRRAPMGHVRLSASLPAFAESAPVELDLAPGANVEGLELRLRRGARLTGELRAPDGRSAAAWEIHLWNESGGEWKSTESDASGRFAFDGLAGGSYRLSAELPGGSAGGSTSLSATVDVAEGQTAHVVLGRESGTLVAVSGTVRAAGRGVERAGVSVWSGGEQRESFSANTETDASGQYRLELPAGTYAFGVSAGGTHLGREVAVPPGAAHTEDFELGTGTIRGRVLTRDGTPIEDVRLQLALDASERELRSGAWGGFASSAADGTFEFAYVGPGTYSIEAYHFTPTSPGARGKSYGALVRRGIAVAPGATVEGIELVLEEGGSIAGRVTDAVGQPAEGAFVILSDESGALLDGQVERVGPDGAYSLTGVAPGRYTVRALDGEQVSESSALLSVPSGGEARADLQLRRSGWLRVIVEDSSGATVGASLSVSDARGRPVHGLPWGGSSSPGEGQRIGPFLPGTYRVTATNHDRVNASAAAEVVAGETRELRLRLGGG